jgi:hypothetical protein
MTLDNQSAYIQVGKRVPRIVGSRFDNRISQNTIELEPIGLILAVTPRISPDGAVTMEIDAEKSEMGAEQDGVPVTVSGDQVIRSPSFTVTRAQTTVSAQDGQTVVLGGLISKNKTTIHRRVPGLASIPILGNIFRYDLEIEKRTELLIILTPHVIQNEEQMEQMKQLESSRIHWCLADVTEMFGDTGLYDIADDSLNDGAATVIYPDDNPTEASPEGYELLNPPMNEGAWPPSPNAAPSEPTPAAAPSRSEVSTSQPNLRERFFASQRSNQPPNGQVAPMPNSYQGGSPTYAAQPPLAAPQGYAPQFDSTNPLRTPNYQPPVPTAEYNTPFPDPNAPSQVKQTNYIGPRQPGAQSPRMEPYPQRTQEPPYYQSDAGWKQWGNTVYR